MTKGTDTSLLHSGRAAWGYWRPENCIPAPTETFLWTSTQFWWIQHDPPIRSDNVDLCFLIKLEQKKGGLHTYTAHRGICLKLQCCIFVHWAALMWICFKLMPCLVAHCWERKVLLIYFNIKALSHILHKDMHIQNKMMKKLVTYIFGVTRTITLKPVMELMYNYSSSVL